MRVLLRFAVVCLLILGLWWIPARAQEPLHLVVDTGSPNAGINGAAFLGDGKTLVTVGDDKVVRFWDTINRHALPHPIWLNRDDGDQDQIKALAGDIEALAVSPGGNDIALGGYIPDGSKGYEVLVIDAASRKVVATLRGAPIPILALAFSPTNPNQLAGGGDYGRVYLWDLTRPSNPKQDHDASSSISSVAFSPDGAHLAVAYDDNGALSIFDLSSFGKGAKQIMVGDAQNGVNQIAWSKNNVIACAESGAVKLADPGSRAVTATVPVTGTAFVVAFTPDGGRIVAGGGDSTGRTNAGFATLIDAATHNPLGTFTGNDGVVTAIAISADGSIASAGGPAGSICIWKQPDDPSPVVLSSAAGACTDVRWSMPGSSARPDYRLDWSEWNAQSHRYGRIGFDATACQEAPPLTQGPQAQPNVQIAADQQSVTINGVNYSAAILLPANVGDSILSAVVAPDGGFFVGTHLYLFRYDSQGHPLATYAYHVGGILSMAISPDGKYLASASNDQTIAIWPAAVPSGARTTPFGGQKGQAIALVEPLMHVMADRFGYWDAWTQKGYFDCSPEARGNLKWIQNDPSGAEATALEAGNFARYYSAQTMKLLLAKGNEDDAFATAMSDPPAIDSLTLDPPIPAGTGPNSFATIVKVHVTAPASAIVTGVTCAMTTETGDGQSITTQVPLTYTDGYYSGPASIAAGDSSFDVIAVTDAAQTQQRIFADGFHYDPHQTHPGLPPRVAYQGLIDNNGSAAVLPEPGAAVLQAGATNIFPFATNVQFHVDGRGQPLATLVTIYNGAELDRHAAVKGAWTPAHFGAGHVVRSITYDGANTVTIAVDLREGDHQFMLQAINAAGRIGSDSGDRFKYDPEGITVPGLQSQPLPSVQYLSPQVTDLPALSARTSPTFATTARFVISRPDRSGAITADNCACTINGQAVNGAYNAATGLWSGQVTLQQGANDIEMTVTTANGTEVNAGNTIEYGLPTPPPLPTAYVLAVGISDYSPPVQRLDAAASDAREFWNTLEAQKGKSLKDVVAVNDMGYDGPLLDYDATREHILGSIAALKANTHILPTDLVVVYIAGHGTSDGGQYWIVPSDADSREDLSIYGVAWDEIYGALYNIPAHKLVITDTCHSGDTDTDPSAQGSFASLLQEVQKNDMAFVQIAACDSTQTSLEGLESDNKRHGIFTYWLCKGLSGDAAEPGSRVVTMQDLEQYLESKVPANAAELSSASGGATSQAGLQQPVFAPELLFNPNNQGEGAVSSTASWLDLPALNPNLSSAIMARNLPGNNTVGSRVGSTLQGLDYPPWDNHPWKDGRVVPADSGIGSLGLSTVDLDVGASNTTWLLEPAKAFLTDRHRCYTIRYSIS